MKKLLLLSILFFNSIISFSQVPTIQWQKSFGGTNLDMAYAIQQTADGGYIVAGGTVSNDGDVTQNNGGLNYWIIKLDNTGGIQWQKNYGGSGNDVAKSIKQTNDGGYIVAGCSSSNNMDVTSNNGFEDYWIVKLDNIGTIQWQKSLGGSLGDGANSIQQTFDGGFIIAGSASSGDGDVIGYHGGPGDCWIIKMDNTGTIQWQKCLGGTGNEEANEIKQTTDGGYIVVGYSDSNDGDVTGNHAWNDYWIVKLNNFGNIQWQKCLGGTSHEIANAVQQTTDGGYIITGFSNSIDGDITTNNGDYDYWIVKLNNLGSIQWQKSLGGSGGDFAKSIQQTTDGGYIVAGSSDSNDGNVTGNHAWNDYWVVKLNNFGSIQWQKSVGGTDFDNAFSIQQTTDGGYVVAGYSGSNNGDLTGNQGLDDYWIVKLSATTTGVEENTIQNLISVYPNPNTGTFIIKTKSAGTYSIINELGQTIKQFQLNNSSC